MPAPSRAARSPTPSPAGRGCALRGPAINPADGGSFVLAEQGEIFFGDSLLVIAPGAKATLTSLDTRSTTTVNAAGPGRSTFVENDDGSATFTLVGTGNWLVFNVDDPSDPIKLIQRPVHDHRDLGRRRQPCHQQEDFSQARVVNMCEVLG